MGLRPRKHNRRTVFGQAGPANTGMASRGREKALNEQNSTSKRHFYNQMIAFLLFYCNFVNR